MNKNYAPAPLFKDFEKPIKDFRTVGFAEPGSWKVEVKDKHPSSNVFYANPLMTVGLDGKKAMQVEFGFNAACGGALKVIGKPEENILKGSKWTGTWKARGQKMDITAQVLPNCGEGKCPFRYKLEHEGFVPVPDALRAFIPSKKISVHEALQDENVEVGFGMAVAPHCFLGCGAVVGQGEKKCKWKIGSRYTHPTNGLQVHIQTAALKNFAASFMAPVSCLMCPITKEKLPLTVGALGTFDVTSKRVTGEAVMEVGCPAAKKSSCPLATDSTIKVKINNVGNVIVAYTLKGAQNWTASFSIDKSLKAGITVTHK